MRKHIDILFPPYTSDFIYMKQMYKSTVIAVQKGSQGEIISNPPTDYQLEDIDYLIVIASEKP